MRQALHWNFTLFSLILVITTGAISSLAAQSPAQESFLKTPLLDLKDTHRVRVLKDLVVNHTDQASRYKVGTVWGLIFNDRQAISLSAGTKIEFTVSQYSDYLIAIRMDSEGPGVISICDEKLPATSLTVADFNRLFAGSLEIVNESAVYEDEEGLRLDHLDMPAKIRFEEDLMVSVMQDEIRFQHPSQAGKEIRIKLKQKQNRKRVIAKSTEFEIQSIVYGINNTTRILLNSNDIEMIECVNTTPRVFATSDFYEIMGSKASLIQNTEPPTPIQ